MTPGRHQDIKRVFLAALDQPRDQWSRVVREMTGDDADLRREVEILLDSHLDAREHLGISPTADPKHSVWAGAASTPGSGGKQRPEDVREQATRSFAARPPAAQRPASEARLEARGEPMRPHRSRSSASLEHGRFLPGTVIANRYRIVALVGRGGMGEVYRADDLKLGESVALKFLPIDLADKPARMQQLLDEVRMARGVSHPNVCRVYDVGEHYHELFVSMEFVDGETLDSLISRIGRLPEKKAEQLAQQLCAGLAAVHDAGILHRDLKPANVMIDGRGQVRVNDFGLASARELHGLAAVAGTPGFVPPESLAGRSATVRSDIYALGLVLYELFTGVPAYQARTREQLLLDQESKDPDPPSTHAPDLSPEIDRAVMKCLQRDPEDRPGSAREVAASLPGGDALAAAIAMGETPSPSVVAASGRKGVLTLFEASLAVLSFAALLSIALMLGQQGSLLRRVTLPRSPTVLADRARSIVSELGYPDDAVSEAYDLDLYDEWLQELVERDTTVKRGAKLARLRPAPIDFWYRSSPAPLLPRNSEGKITFYDPTFVERGMIGLRLSPRGDLREFEASSDDLFWPREVPKGAEHAPLAATADAKPPPEPDWSIAFRHASLDMRHFVPVEPKRIPPVFADTRRAWRGTYPENPEEPVQVEIAALNGRIVAFRTVELNWQGSQAAVPGVNLLGHAQEAGLVLLVVLQVATLIVAMVLARRNLRDRRGDRSAAWRLALFLFLATLVYGVLSADTLSSQNVAFGITLWIMSKATAVGLAAWVLYLGLEPYVRRIWPEALVPWTRLMEGRWRDPLVGQSLLLGGVAGTMAISLAYVNRSIPAWIGQPPAIPFYLNEFNIEGLGGLSRSIALYLHILVKAVQVSMGFVGAIALLRLIVKRPWAAMLLFGLVQTAIWTLMPNAFSGWWSPLIVGLIVAGATMVLIRYGLLGLISMAVTFLILGVGPITMEPASWFHDRSVAALVIVTGVVIYGAAVAIFPGPQAMRMLTSGTAAGGGGARGSAG